MSFPVSVPALAATAVLLLPHREARGNYGSPDLAFNGDGLVRTVVDHPVLAGAMALQGDGKILVAEMHAVANQLQLSLYRFLPDGAPDAAFGAAGRAFTAPFAAPFDVHTTALFVLEDGRILVIASSGRGDGFCSFARWNEDGTPDETLNPDGLLPNQFLMDGVNPVFVRLNNGTFLCSVNPLNVYRLSPEGAPDISFAQNGRLSLGTAEGHALAVQTDGKFLLAKNYRGFAVRRLSPNGSTDESFGFFGESVLFQPGVDWVQTRCLLPMADGRILAAAEMVLTPPGNPPLGLARLLPNGSPDAAFGTSGATIFSTEPLGGIRAVLLQEDGRILVAGHSGETPPADATSRDLTLTRFHTGGTLDNTFGSGGKVRTDTGGSETCLGAVLFPNDRLLVAALRKPRSPGTAPDELVLARYLLSDGPRVRVTGPGGSAVRNEPSAPPQDLGMIPTGSRSREFTLRNTGTQPLTDIEVSLTNASHPGEFFHTHPLHTTLAPATETTFIVTLTPAAAAAPGPRSATVKVTSNDPAAPFVIPVTGGKPTPSQTWRLTWFGSPDNSGPGADLNDFDGDGIPNLLEYATLSHPHQTTPSIGSLTKTGDGALTFTWSRPKASLTELTFQVETAAAPGGPWTSTGITEAVLTDDGIAQSVRSLIPDNLSAAGRQFVRLRITRL